MPVVRGFVSPFAGREGTDARYLAARLVWAATHVRLFRDSAAHNRPRKRDEIRQAALEAQLRFLQQLPDTSELQDFVRKEGP